MRKSYKVIGAGVSPIDGWYRWTLRRNDGRIVTVGKTRLRQLRKQGRLVE